MTSRHQSRGFVTASMSLLLFGLSIITMAFLAFAMNEHAATQRTIDQIDIDNAKFAADPRSLVQKMPRFGPMKRDCKICVQWSL